MSENRPGAPGGDYAVYSLTRRSQQAYALTLRLRRGDLFLRFRLRNPKNDTRRGNSVRAMLVAAAVVRHGGVDNETLRAIQKHYVGRSYRLRTFRLFGIMDAR